MGPIHSVVKVIFHFQNYFLSFYHLSGFYEHPKPILICLIQYLDTWCLMLAVPVGPNPVPCAL